MNIARFFRIPKLLLAISLLTMGFMSPSLQAAEADGKTAAVAAMEKWLKDIDAGKYAESWKEASPLFQKAVTSAQWTQALNAARTPLGKCLSRELASAFQQTEIPSPDGTLLKGDFVIAQFDASFANLKYAVETVTFEKVSGTWQASGYFVKPK